MQSSSARQETDLGFRLGYRFRQEAADHFQGSRGPVQLTCQGSQRRTKLIQAIQKIAERRILEKGQAGKVVGHGKTLMIDHQQREFPPLRGAGQGGFEIADRQVRLLAFDPEARYQAARPVRVDLERVGRGRRLARPSRSPVGWLLAATVALALVGLGVTARR